MKIDNNENKIITFSEREVSYFIAALVAGLFFVFVAGYFVGKKRMCEEITLRDDVQFAERVRLALASLQGPSDVGEVDDDDLGDAIAVEQATLEKASLEKAGSAASAQTLPQTQAVAVDAQTGKQAAQAVSVSRPAVAAPIVDTAGQTVSSSAVAEKAAASRTRQAVAYLCGFTSKQLAEKYVQRLLGRGIRVRLIERASKSSSGRVSYWYQVATEPYDRKELRSIVARLRREDRLSGIVVVYL